MEPLRTNAHHELRFFRERPWLLEQEVDVPFRGVAGKERCNTRLQFQPVLDWRDFNRDRRTEARSAFVNTPVSGSSNLHDRDRLLVYRLREGMSQKEAKIKTRYQRRSCPVQNRPRSLLALSKQTNTAAIWMGLSHGSHSTFSAAPQCVE